MPVGKSSFTLIALQSQDAIVSCGISLMLVSIGWLRVAIHQLMRVDRDRGRGGPAPLER